MIYGPVCGKYPLVLLKYSIPNKGIKSIVLT